MWAVATSHMVSISAINQVNNDVEGWHRQLNQKSSRGQLNMYLLLDGESQLLEMQLTLLKESAHIRHQQKSSHRVTARLFTLWDRLVADERMAQETLCAAAYLMPVYCFSILYCIC